MENEHLALNDSLAGEEPLPLPHFDDEATVQSARPVVPLHEVRKASRSKRRMILLAALCLSALVGAVAASLVYSNRAQRVEESATATIPESAQDSSAFITPSGEASGSIINPDEAVATDAETARNNRSDDGLEVKTATPGSQPRAIKNARVLNPVEKVVSEPKPQDREADSLPEQTIREERREARRLRRERRVNQRRTGDGLTRIREIFEGSPRP